MLRWFVAVLVLIQCDSNVNKVCSRNVLFTHDIVRLFEKVFMPHLHFKRGVSTSSKANCAC